MGAERRHDYRQGGNLFDVDRRDPAFFARFKDSVAKAGERGVVVEVCFYNAQYKDTWPLSPLFPENNIQGIGGYELQGRPDPQKSRSREAPRRLRSARSPPPSIRSTT